MGKILINLVPLNKNNQKAVQGIKLFLNKNKNANVIALAEENNILTLKNHKNITIINFNDELIKNSAPYSKIKDDSLRVAIKLLHEDEDINGFVTYNQKEEVALAAKSYLTPKTVSPLFVATFANFETHRVTCIGDLGYEINPSNNDYKNYLKLMQQYMKQAFKIENPEFKLLTYNEKNINPLVKIFEKEKGYKGQIEGNKLLKCDTDIVVGNPHEFLGIISGLNQGISIYDEYIKSQVKKNVGIRLFSYPTFKSVLINFHLEIDQKLTSGGNILLGYKKNIVVIDPDTIKQGVKVSINLASKLAEL